MPQVKQSNEQIKESLRYAGIPREVFSTTLMLQGLDAMRGFVVSKAYEQSKVICVHKEASHLLEYSTKLDLAFYLLAKEMVLAGVSVYCCSLAEVHSAFFDIDMPGAEDTAVRLREEDTFIGIRGFHDFGGNVTPFLTPKEVAFIGSWIIRKQQADAGGVILQTALPLMDCEAWWPTSLLGYLRSRSTSFSVPV